MLGKGHGMGLRPFGFVNGVKEVGLVWCGFSCTNPLWDHADRVYSRASELELLVMVCSDILRDSYAGSVLDDQLSRPHMQA